MEKKLVRKIIKYGVIINALLTTPTYSEFKKVVPLEEEKKEMHDNTNVETEKVSLLEKAQHIKEITSDLKNGWPIHGPFFFMMINSYIHSKELLDIKDLPQEERTLLDSLLNSCREEINTKLELVTAMCSSRKYRLEYGLTGAYHILMGNTEKGTEIFKEFLNIYDSTIRPFKKDELFGIFDFLPNGSGLYDILNCFDEKYEPILLEIMPLLLDHFYSGKEAEIVKFWMENDRLAKRYAELNMDDRLYLIYKMPTKKTALDIILKMLEIEDNSVLKTAILSKRKDMLENNSDTMFVSVATDHITEDDLIKPINLIYEHTKNIEKLINRNEIPAICVNRAATMSILLRTLYVTKDFRKMTDLGKELDLRRSDYADTVVKKFKSLSPTGEDIFRVGIQRIVFNDEEGKNVIKDYIVQNSLSDETLANSLGSISAYDGRVLKEILPLVSEYIQYKTLLLLTKYGSESSTDISGRYISEYIYPYLNNIYAIDDLAAFSEVLFVEMNVLDINGNQLDFKNTQNGKLRYDLIIGMLGNLEPNPNYMKHFASILQYEDDPNLKEFIYTGIEEIINMPRERLLIWKDYLKLDIPETINLLNKYLKDTTLQETEQNRIESLIKRLGALSLILGKGPIRKQEEKPILGFEKKSSVKINSSA